MTRDILRIPANQPTVLRLDSARGLESKGRFGIDYRFDVVGATGPAWLYLTTQGTAAMERSGARDGDEVEIVKIQREGQQLDWRIRVVSIQRGHGVVAMPRPTHAESPAHVPQPRPALPARGAAIQPYRREAAQVPAKPMGTTDLLTRCMTAAIDVAMAGEAHAKQKEFPLEFTSEDIRSMAISIYINKNREQERAA